MATLGLVLCGVTGAEAACAERSLRQGAGRLRLAGRAADGGSVRYRPSLTSFGADQTRHRSRRGSRQ